MCIKFVSAGTRYVQFCFRPGLTQAPRYFTDIYTDTGFRNHEPVSILYTLNVYTYVLLSGGVEYVLYRSTVHTVYTRIYGVRSTSYVATLVRNQLFGIFVTALFTALSQSVDPVATLWQQLFDLLDRAWN